MGEPGPVEHPLSVYLPLTWVPFSHVTSVPSPGPGTEGAELRVNE